WVRPRFRTGPYTGAQRAVFLQGQPGEPSVSPHHRHQLSTTLQGGVIDELTGPGHPEGNVHTTGSRHPAPSFLNQFPGLREQEITAYWLAKGLRLIEIGPDRWIDPGP